MHLTRLLLDPRSAQARRDLADPYDMHRSLTRAFVSDASQTPPRFLWRLEAGSVWSDPVVLVQSVHAADWTLLRMLPGYLKRDVEAKAVDLKQLLHDGMRYRFRLYANPTVTREGKRYGLVSEDAQFRWLGRQGERSGFTVEAALVTSNDLLTSRQGGASITLQRACFEGIFKAKDSAALAGALQAGIGPGKAFGCGLLSVVRC